MTNEEIQEIVAKADAEYDRLKDRLHEQYDEIERLNNIIEEQYKELELEKKSRQLLTDDLANVCKISLKKDNIIKKVLFILEHMKDDRVGYEVCIDLLKGSVKE